MKTIGLMSFAVSVLAISGCSDGIRKFPCAETSGVVLCDDKPVQGAIVYFSPTKIGRSAVVGKPGFAITDQAGHFVLSTYGSQDGAVVGAHIVRVTTSNEFPCNCVGEETRDLMDVEIVAEKSNEFEIRLPGRTAPARKNPFDDE